MARSCSNCGDPITALSEQADHCEDCLTRATLVDLGINPDDPAATPDAVRSLVN